MTTYDMFNNWYFKGLYTDEQLHKCVEAGLITEEQYQKIVATGGGATSLN